MVRIQPSGSKKKPLPNESEVLIRSIGPPENSSSDVPAVGWGVWVGVSVGAGVGVRTGVFVGTGVSVEVGNGVFVGVLVGAGEGV